MAKKKTRTGRPVGTGRPARALTPAEEKRALAAAKLHGVDHRSRKWLGRKDMTYVLLLLMLNTGMRIGEAVGLAIEDVIENGEIASSFVLTKDRTKTNESRRVYLNQKIRKALALFLQDRADRNDESPWLFPGNKGMHLNAAYGSQLLKQVFEAAGLKEPSHACRKTFATRLAVERGVSVFVLKELLGHASLASTQRYCSVSEAQLSGAVETLV